MSACAASLDESLPLAAAPSADVAPYDRPLAVSAAALSSAESAVEEEIRTLPTGGVTGGPSPAHREAPPSTNAKTHALVKAVMYDFLTVKRPTK
jgi:hypothetical protein